MRSRPKVLIVEDDNAMAQMCAKLIQRRGYSAIIACSCNDAIAIVRDAGDIDVVISDVQMPTMTGIQLLGRIRAIDQTMPVILMTGYAHVLGPDEATDLGATDYILKPFDAETLVHSVERARRSRHNLARK